MCISSIRQTSINNKVTFLQIGNISQVKGITGRSRAGTLESRGLQGGRDNTEKIDAKTTLPPPCSILPTNHVLPAACDALRTQRSAAAGARKEIHAGGMDNRLWGLWCPYSYFPGRKAAAAPSLPVGLHNGSGKDARQLPAVQGKGVQQRNIISLHFSSLGKEKNPTVSIITWSVTFGLSQTNKKHHKKNPMRGGFLGGRMGFCSEGGHLCVQLGRKENV